MKPPGSFCNLVTLRGNSPGVVASLALFKHNLSEGRHSLQEYHGNSMAGVLASRSARNGQNITVRLASQASSFPTLTVFVFVRAPMQKV